MVYKDLSFEIFARIRIFKLYKESLVRTVTVAMIEETFKKFDAIGLGISFKKIIYSVLKFLLKDLNLSLVRNLIGKSLQVIERGIRAHVRNCASHSYSLHC